MLEKTGKSVKIKRAGWAVTGGIASGKSTVCQEFQKLGAVVVSADQIVHHLYKTHQPLRDAIGQTFGPDCVCCGDVDRKRLLDVIVSHPEPREQLDKLEHLVHPLVIRYLLYIPKPRLFVAEIPLLYETGLDKLFTHTLVVSSPRPYRSMPYLELLETRMLALEEKNRRADMRLYNDKIQELPQKVLAIYHTLVQGDTP